jgi:hypothetical protein
MKNRRCDINPKVNALKGPTRLLGFICMPSVFDMIAISSSPLFSPFKSTYPLSLYSVMNKVTMKWETGRQQKR